MPDRRRFLPAAALVALGAVAAAPSTAGAAQPVAAYGFEDGAGSTAADATGNGHTGHLSGATWTPDGRWGGALCFDGVADRVTVAPDRALDFRGRMTVEAWVRPERLRGWSPLVVKERNARRRVHGGFGYALYAADPSRVPAAHAGNVRARGRAPLRPGVWSHVAMTLGGRVLRLYVDGVQVGAKVMPRNLEPTSGPLSIGGSDGWHEDFFAGCLDELRLYDETLTPEQIAADAATPVGDCAPGRYGARCQHTCDCAPTGTCSDGVGGDGSCLCKPGFGGARCETCATGFYGPKCEKRCACLNGACDDGTDGTGACTCAAGFAGERCDACAPLHYGPGCAPCECENGARCAEGIGATGACRCPAGFAGTRCEECASGYHGRDCKPCACERGECSDGLRGDGTCACEHGFTGAACDACASGLFGADCEGTCACVNGTCSAGRTGDGSCACPAAHHGTYCEYRCGDGRVDPDEACDDGNRDLGDGCDTTCRIESGGLECKPGSPDCTVEITRPKTCIEATDAYCLGFATVTFSQFASFVAAQGGSDASEECYAYSEAVCARCPVPTLEECADPDSKPPFGSPCYFGSYIQCARLFAEVCPEATLTKCANASFYNQTGFFGHIAECRDHVRAACDRLVAEACPTTGSLDACAPLLADLDAVQPPECRTHVEDGCEDTLGLLCPSATTTLCAQADAGSATVHALCLPRLEAACDGWRDALCPGEIVYTIDAESCALRLDLLTRPAVSPACAAWVEVRCRELVGDAAQAHFEGGSDEGHAGCDTRTVVPTGDYAFNVDPSVSDKGDFDCTPVEVSPVHPHDQVFALTPLEAVLVAFPILTLQRDVGTEAIRSCTEYVDQKYWDYALFKAFTLLFAEDARRVFQAAYSTDPGHVEYAMGARVLAQTGVNVFGQFPDRLPRLEPPAFLGSRGQFTASQKNDYVDLKYGSNASTRELLTNYAFWAAGPTNPLEIAARNAKTQGILDKLVALEAYWEKGGGFGPQDGWHWHRRMSQAMRDQGIDDEELNHLFDRRKRFRAVLAQIETVRENIELAEQLPGGLSRVIALNTRLKALVRELADLLDDADSRGCFDDRLDAAGNRLPAPCDWAPADFVAEVDRHFTFHRDRDLQRCRRLAPADLAMLSGGYPYFYVDGNGLVQQAFYSQDPRQGITLFELYLEREERGRGLKALFFASIPPEQAPSYGQQYGDADEVGRRKYFAAGYDYGASWGLDVPDNRRNVCKMNANAEAHLDVYLYVADHRWDIVDAGATADTETLVFETHLNVLGVPLWQAGSTRPGPERPELDYQYNVVFDAGNTEWADGDSLTVPIFSIAGFDINLTAGYSGRLGIDVDGRLSLGLNLDAGECSTGMDLAMGLTATPYVVLNGFLELGIDLFVVELGIGGELTLIDARVPSSFSVGASAAATTWSFDAVLDVDMTSKVVVSTLAGRLYVYADTWWKKYKKTFFEWTGKTWETTLLDKHYELNLGLVSDYCASHACE